MNVEKEVRRTVRRMVFWRVVCHLLHVPGGVLNAAQGLLEVFITFFNRLSDTAFYFELEAARRYRLLTGLDLGVAAGYPARYTGLTETAVAEAEERVNDDE